MPRTSAAAPFGALPADLRRLIEETENSMDVLYRRVDGDAPRGVQSSRHRGSHSSRAVHNTRHKHHRGTDRPDGSRSEDSESDASQPLEQYDKTSRQPQHGLPKQPSPARASHHLHALSTPPSSEASSSFAHSPAEQLGQPTRHRHLYNNSVGTHPAAPPPRRAYRHVTYPDEDDDEAIETVGNSPATATAVREDTPASLTRAAPAFAQSRRASSGGGGGAYSRPPARNTPTNDAGLCQSTLPNTTHNESLSFLSRSAAAAESTPTKMLTQFGHRWDARYRQLLSQVADTSLDGAGLSPNTTAAAPAPAAAREGQAEPVPAVTRPETGFLSSYGRGKDVPLPTGPAPTETRTPTVAETVLVVPPSAPAPPPAPSSNELAAVAAQRDALEETVRAKERELLESERARLMQIAALREDIATARLDGAREAREQLATSASLKESILQAALETERQRTAEISERAKEAEKALRDVQRRVDEQETKLTFQERSSALRDQEMETLQARAVSLETQLSQAADVRRELEDTARRAQSATEALERKWQLAMREREHLETRLSQQEESAKATLAQLEKEFEEATARYQELLDEATHRVEQLEKVQRKYKSLKDTHQRVAETSEETTASLRRQLADREGVVETLQKELQAAQKEVAKLQTQMKADGDAHEEKLQSLQRQLELKGASSSEQVKTMQQHLETANHTIALLRTQIDGLKEDIREEQVQAQQASMRMAEVEMRLKEEVVEQQREAGLAKSRHSEALTALKQQLKEKNAKLEALAASSMEPLQRLREQLESERGKRAHLEEQLSRLKKRAKEAEEATLRELRREQLRQSTEAAVALLTPTTTSTARPSPTPSPVVVASPSVLNSAYRHTPTAVHSPVPSWAMQSARSSRYDAVSQPHSPQGSRLASADARARTAPAVDDPSDTALLGERAHTSSSHPSARREGSHSPPQVQTTAIIEYTPPRRVGHTDNHDTVTTATAPPVPLSLSEWQSHRERERPPLPERLPRHVDTSAPRRGSGRTSPAQPAAGESLSRPAPLAITSTPRIALPEPRGVAVVGDGAADTSLASPATVGSLSGITRSSPCNSTSRLDEDVSVGTGEGATATVRPSQPVRRSRTASPVPAAGRLASSAGDAGEAGDTTATGPVVAEHEQRMRAFRASAAEVMQRLSGSREAFLSRCAEVIQRSSALGTQAAFDDDDDGQGGYP